jgi:2-phosphosulfolactate phosphatase
VKVGVAFTPAELGGSAGERTVAVIDVLRATTTMLEALVNGAQAVVPVESVDVAVTKAGEIGRDQAVLCGERDTQPIPGFHLGNSPAEFTAAEVAGKTLIMTTTNGTRAAVLGSASARGLIASFLNAGAVAAALSEESNVLLLCAGREGRFALEDALCAGMIARRIRSARPAGSTRFDDGAVTAMLLARRYEGSLGRILRRTAAGRRLAELGRDGDVEFCAQVDRYDRVPVVRERRVTL